MRKKHILIIYTGGTIGMLKNRETQRLSPVDFDKLIDHLPDLHSISAKMDTLSFEKPLDSSNILPKHWVEIAKMIAENYNAYDGFVVLHGTDTMAYATSALSFMLENLSKPIIFTGSQLPIGDLRTDAKENLITALHLASMETKIPFQEVLLYFKHKLFRGNRVTKISTEHFNAFDSPNFPVLGQVGVSIHLEYALLKAEKRLPVRPLKLHTQMDKRVVIVKIHPGFPSELIEAIIKIPNIKGILLETYGNGNIPQDPLLLKALEKGIEKGIFITNVTQCLSGFVNQKTYETAHSLEVAGVVGAQDLTTEAAFTKMIFLLGKGYSDEKIKKLFSTSIHGELSTPEKTF